MKNKDDSRETDKKEEAEMTVHGIRQA